MKRALFTIALIFVAYMPVQSASLTKRRTAKQMWSRSPVHQSAVTRKPPKWIEQCDEWRSGGGTQLISAIVDLDVRRVKCLLKMGANGNAKDLPGWTPLLCANYHWDHLAQGSTFVPMEDLQNYQVLPHIFELLIQHNTALDGIWEWRSSSNYNIIRPPDTNIKVGDVLLSMQHIKLWHEDHGTDAEKAMAKKLRADLDLRKILARGLLKKRNAIRARNKPRTDAIVTCAPASDRNYPMIFDIASIVTDYEEYLSPYEQDLLAKALQPREPQSDTSTHAASAATAGN